MSMKASPQASGSNALNFGFSDEEDEDEDAKN